MILLRSKRFFLIVTAFVILFAAIVLLLAQPRARTTLRLVNGFSPLEADPRIYHEAGAEDLAAAIADALPAAISRVEQHQAGPFESPFRVYVCATHGNFTQHIGQPETDPVRGIAFLWDVWISPKAFSFFGKDTHHQTLLHELSHLHLGQKLGWWKRISGIPSWFQEGLANWIADSGAELVSRRQARSAILNGHHFVPEENGHLPLPKTAGEYGLTWPMFHSQSRLFVSYLQTRDAAAFTGFIAAVMQGNEFASAFEENYHTDLNRAWADFLDSLQSDTGIE